MSDDLHGQVLFVAKAIGRALDDAKGVVSTFRFALPSTQPSETLFSGLQ